MDERGVVVRTKQVSCKGHRQEEGIDFDEVFALWARLEPLGIFFALPSLYGPFSLSIDVKSAFPLWKIDERSSTIGQNSLPEEGPNMIHTSSSLWGMIYLWVKEILCDEFEALMKSRFQMSSMGELTFFLGLQVKQKEDGIFISQDKYVAEILKKFDFANIGSLMYLTASRPDIMFAVCACSRFQVTPKTSHLSVVKRIFRYLKGKPKLGLWYPRVSSFDLESLPDSDYAGAILTGNHKQEVVNLWNPVYHSKTKHIAFRQSSFIRDAYEKKLIQVLKIHTDDNVADLLTKAFDVSRGFIAFRGSLRRVNDGTEALLILPLFILWLDKVSTASAKLVPLGKVCTALETLKKNTARALISLFTTISLSSTMAVLDSCPKHNMVAYLEKTEGNAEFHEIIDFLKRSSIHHALTSVSISEASIRSDLLFDDADGIDSLPNQAIFDAIQLMGYEGDLTVSDQVKEIQLLKAQITKLKKQAKPVIKHHRAWLKSVSLKQRFPSKSFSKKHRVHKESVSKQGRKVAKGLRLSTEDVLSTDKEVVSTDKEGVSTDKEKVSTDRPIVSTDGSKISTDEHVEGTEEHIEGTEEHIEGTEEHNEAKKKFRSFESDEELARKIQEEWEGERGKETE
ncbi:putative ribonuclease H-like domain-containing protein [Tanacetum coccineum]